MKILLVEDNETDALLAEARLRPLQVDGEVQVRKATTLEQALGYVSWADVCLLDLHLPDGAGLSVVQAMRTAAAPEMQIVVLTGTDDEDTGLQAVANGADDYISKSDANERNLPRMVRYAMLRRGYMIEQARGRQALTQVADFLEGLGSRLDQMRAGGHHAARI